MLLSHTAFLMANAKYKAEQLDEHTYRLSLNVTNTGAVMCVPTGTYTIYARIDNFIRAIIRKEPPTL